MVFEQAKEIRPLPWWRRDLGWWPGAVAAFVMLDCGMALTHPARPSRFEQLERELDTVAGEGGAVHRHTAAECADIVRIFDRYSSVSIGTGRAWASATTSYDWQWAGDECTFRVQHRPAPPSTR